MYHVLIWQYVLVHMLLLPHFGGVDVVDGGQYIDLDFW